MKVGCMVLAVVEVVHKAVLHTCLVTLVDKEGHKVALMMVLVVVVVVVVVVVIGLKCAVCYVNSKR